MNHDKLLQLSELLAGIVERIGKFGSIFILPLVFVTMWDVFFRKIGGLQVWLIDHFGSAFESTVLQEYEWHFHTAFFTLVLGYGFINNRHVRVDLFYQNWSFRTQAIIEFVGISLFLIPYCLIVGYFATDYAIQSFMIGEKSASTVGLSYRWIIKSSLAIGLYVAALAGIAVWLQSLVVLIAPKDKRFKLMTLEWPEEQERKKLLQAKRGQQSADTAQA